MSGVLQDAFGNRSRNSSYSSVTVAHSASDMGSVPMVRSITRTVVAPGPAWRRSGRSLSTPSTGHRPRPGAGPTAAKSGSGNSRLRSPPRRRRRGRRPSGGSGGRCRHRISGVPPYRDGPPTEPPASEPSAEPEREAKDLVGADRVKADIGGRAGQTRRFGPSLAKPLALGRECAQATQRRVEGEQSVADPGDGNRCCGTRPAPPPPVRTCAGARRPDRTPAPRCSGCPQRRRSHPDPNATAVTRPNSSGTARIRDRLRSDGHNGGRAATRVGRRHGREPRSCSGPPAPPPSSSRVTAQT